MKDARAIFIWCLTLGTGFIVAVSLVQCARETFDPPPHFLHYDR